MTFNSGNGSTSARRPVAAVYMPSGKTMLHVVGLYEKAGRARRWYHARSTVTNGIHQVLTTQNKIIQPFTKPATGANAGTCGSNGSSPAPASTVMALPPTLIQYGAPTSSSATRTNVSR